MYIQASEESVSGSGSSSVSTDIRANLPRTTSFSLTGLPQHSRLQIIDPNVCTVTKPTIRPKESEVDMTIKFEKTPTIFTGDSTRGGNMELNHSFNMTLPGT